MSMPPNGPASMLHMSEPGRGQQRRRVSTSRGPTALVTLGLSALALALIIPTGCGPKRGLPPTDLGTDQPIEVMAPTGHTQAGTYTPPGRRRTADDPRVSRSRGESGGILLLWPRVIPSVRTQELRNEAQLLQAALGKVIGSAHPGRTVDARPEPERVCPAAGCKAAAVGVVLLVNATGCAAVVQTTQPGKGPATQTPWVGDVTLKAPTVAFRQPPESYVRVSDYVPCKTIGSYLAARQAQILTAIRALR